MNKFTVELPKGRIKAYEKAAIISEKPDFLVPMSFVEIGDKERITYNYDGLIPLGNIENCLGVKDIFDCLGDVIASMRMASNLLIFPEKDEKHNNILYQFQENFVDIARLYEKKTGKPLTFVPMYIAPTLRKMYIGKGIVFNRENDAQEERKRIAGYLSEEITRMARELPRHKVVPYRNIPRKYYLTNKDITEVPHEKTCR